MKKVLQYLLVMLVIAVLLIAGIVYGLNALSPTQTVRPTENVPVETHTPTAHTCTVTTGVPDGDLNLRTGAGTEYAVIDTLKEGDVLTVIADGDWMEVTFNGRRGFINGQYCR